MKCRALYISLVLALFSTFVFAQNYGNSWISFNQTYYKFPVTKSGLFRIDSTTLASKFNLQTLNPKNLQLFIKGKQQALYIKGESDNKINVNDYIEFYASYLRRDFDSLLYAQINYHPSPYFPYFNDTIFGYLTAATSTNNLRYIEETDSTIANYPLADHFYTELTHTLFTGYNYVYDVQNVYGDPRYTQAEGSGWIINKGATISTNFPNVAPYTASSLPCYVDLSYSGSSIEQTTLTDHEVNFDYIDNLTNTVTLHNSVFFGYQPARVTLTLASTSIPNVANFRFTSVANASFTAFNNQTMFHYLNFKYPKISTLGGVIYNQLLIDDAPGSGKQSFVLSSPNAGTSNTIVAYDITNAKKLPVYVLGGNARMVVPNSGGQKEVIVCAESGITSITTLSDVNQGQFFTNFKSSGASNAFVIVYHPSLLNSAQLYKIYRQSVTGGANNVIMANVQELYDQFGYGIPKHPQAIRNFMRFLHDSLPSSPAYLFMIGKGVDCSNLSPASQQYNLIPTMGNPSSDNLLTAGITNSAGAYPEIPVGRLAAMTNSEVTNYLTKIQQHETSGLADWKKHVLHFIGGDTPILTDWLSSYMDSYKYVIQDTLFGAQVYTFKKNTTAPVQTVISDSIKNSISAGASIITFFGHGSSTGFDQAIDEPDQYNNAGRYPLVIANSCYSGDIHLAGITSVSEKFVFANQSGALGFLATTSYGYPMALNFFTYNFYKAISSLRYGKGLGNSIVYASMLSSLDNDKTFRYTGLDFTLHGDPSVKIFTGMQPDYSVANNDVKFDLKKYVDSIGIFIYHKNLSMARKDSFFVKIERFFPNGDSVSFLKRIKAPYYNDSLKFYIPLDFTKGIGLNKFKVRLDQFNETTEITKANNATIGTVDLFIKGGDINPVYPYKYAIIPVTPTITLKASTSDPFSPSARYKFQLDTCDRFLNPMTQTLITSSGGVLEWNVSLPFADSTVYFWRVSKDSITAADQFVWKESSFQTIGTKKGWSQAHFNQFKTNTYRFVKYNKALRRFDFNNNVQSITARNGMQPFIPPVNINYAFNNIVLSNWGCAPDGWNFAVFDSISGEPQPVVSINYPLLGPGTYSNCVCVDNQVLYVYSFGQSNYCGFGNWQADMEAFLNAISPNNYVLAYNMGALTASYSQVQSYSNSLYTAFETIGTNNIRTTKDTIAMIIFGRKGMSPGQAHEIRGVTRKDIITLEDSIKTRWNSGYIASDLIGPAYKWTSLHWQLKPFDALPGDTTLLKVVGIRNNGQRDTLVTLKKDSTDILALYNYADAATYPFIQLVAMMKDNIHRTSPQLRKWQIVYDQAPECAINPLKGFAALNDTLQEGDFVKFKIPIENIGKETFTDSLVFTYWIEDKNKVIHTLPQKIKKNNFAPGEVIMDTVALSSLQYVGSNALWIDVNPPAHPKYQREQEHFNNIARLAYKVDKDITNPLLDVTFDGIRILNGDIVSAKPSILVTLKDENKFLALNDTAAFTVYLKYPGQSTSKRVYFANGLQFTPANLPNNACKINYTPVLTTDGIYELTVQGKDRSANRSGVVEYIVQFEVNNKPTVTSVLNYPNPFSTSTKFVFTLTGSQLPDIFTIQIMTVSGKVVKEITKEELGNLHIGRNITDYSWDGKDEFGDKLANGVYLYKVITRLNDSFVEKSGTSADKYFVKEFGKMVIMR
jgi:hypothetical protein